MASINEIVISSSSSEDDDDIEEVCAQVKRVYRCKICQTLCTGVFEFLNHYESEHRKNKDRDEYLPSTSPARKVEEPQEVIQLDLEGPNEENNLDNLSGESKPIDEGRDGESSIDESHDANIRNTEDKEGCISAPLQPKSIVVVDLEDSEGDIGTLKDPIRDSEPTGENNEKESLTGATCNSCINERSTSEEQPPVEILDYLGLRRRIPGEDSPEKEPITPSNLNFYCIKCPMRFATEESLKLHAIRLHIFPIAMAKASIARAKVMRPKRGGRGRPPSKLYCVCKEIFNRDMIGCDSKHCKTQWFHFDCVGVTSPPDGQWYCPICRKEGSRRQSVALVDS